MEPWIEKILLMKCEEFAVTVRVADAGYPGMNHAPTMGTEDESTRIVPATHVGTTNRSKKTREAIDHETGCFDACLEVALSRMTLRPAVATPLPTYDRSLSV